MPKTESDMTIWQRIKRWTIALFEPEPLTLREHWKKYYPELWEKLDHHD